ncbi:carbamate kinase [Ligilactobacillus araffinosus]|uniref:Carbamate kinase n=1 Tax=Ligilactobacillus araffinosus DSM 20653 TaxID=1423820 RepID=A0A0R1ZCE3_9LACO|nr:carbamate kinase [Ligilactobacillus araffinosus]KRM51989.1 carbamate kinase [Ligilactobacillus araffinosus DSM 20653]
MGKRIVVALGGNAIVTKTGTADSQIRSIKETMKKLVQFIEDGDELVITHGNGPQVGNLLLQQINGSSVDNPAMPLDTSVAMTQGSIGYWMQKSLDEVLKEKKLKKNVATIVTQIEVKEDDPAFKNPSKPIGPFYSKHEATVQHTMHSGCIFKEDAGRGYRRVVPSPKPQKIIEAPVIESLLVNGTVPIAAGGGGVPVICKENGDLQGVEAVIDKDFSAAKLAENINADELIILTAVDNVFVNYNQPSQKALTNVTIDELKQYIDEGQFAAGSMLPKVRAVIDFVENTGKKAVITSLKNVDKLIAGGTGTVITK